MHIVVASLLIALVSCVLVLVAFGVFTTTPYAHRLEQDERRRKLSPR